jgi:pimeloyl-ACP methyl ester carboxylesterase
VSAAERLIHKAPGATKYEPITIERGITHDMEFERWANKVASLGAVADEQATASKEAGPFLARHSIGGLISRLYASTYSGLVLIDAFSEDLYNGLTPEQQAAFEKLNDASENYDNVRSIEQVRAAPSVRAIPIVVLTAYQTPITAKDIASGRFPPEVTADFADARWGGTRELPSLLMAQSRHQYLLLRLA